MNGNTNSVYLWSNSEKYAGYLGKEDADERAMCWNDSLMGDPLPTLDNWVTPTLLQYLGEGKNKREPAPIGDAPSSANIQLISGRAADSLHKVWERHAILYPVILEDSPQTNYYMVVVKTELPFEALDRKKSRGKEIFVGPRAHKGLYAVIEEWVFNLPYIRDNLMFTLPDSRTTYFVTEEFRELVASSSLKGFCLRSHFWDENPFLS